MPIPKIILAFCVICFACSGSRGQQTIPPPPKPASDSPNLEATMKFIQDKLNDIGPLRYSVGRQAVDADRDSVFDETDEVSNVVADPERCTISYRLQESAKPEESSGNFDSGYDSARGSAQAVMRVIAYPQPQRSAPAPGGQQESARSRNANFVVDLKQVKKITVRSLEEDLNDVSGGRINWTIRPRIFEVVLQTRLAGYRRQLPASQKEGAGAQPQSEQENFFKAFFGSEAPIDGQGAILGAIVPTQSAPASRPQGTLSWGPLPIEAGVFRVDDEELANRLAKALLHAVELCSPDKKAEPF